MRSRLLEEARGSVIASVDHDDTWSPDHLALVGVRGRAPAEHRPPRVRHLHHTDRRSRRLPARRRLRPDQHGPRPPSPSPPASSTGPASGGIKGWDLWWRLAGRGARFHLDEVVTATACASSPLPPRPSTAGRLSLSETTVKTHVSTLIAKLGVQDRVGAVIHVLRTGLV